MDSNIPEDKLAPPDISYHELYAKNMNAVFHLLAELNEHPSAPQSQDLGDFAEALYTLSTFRPRTRDDIEAKARKNQNA